MFELLKRLFNKKPIGISLGFNCQAAVDGVKLGLRPQRKHGYKTCPFDLCVTNYNGIIECLRDDFRDLANPEFLELRRVPFPPPPGKDWEHWIYNKKYKFFFNHESPYHGNLCEVERWSGGQEHFVRNNFEMFVKRYNRRVQNIKRYLEKSKDIIFIICKDSCDTSELEDVLEQKYPNMRYRFCKLNIQDKAGYQRYMTFLETE